MRMGREVWREESTAPLSCYVEHVFGSVREGIDNNATGRIARASL